MALREFRRESTPIERLEDRRLLAALPSGADAWMELTQTITDHQGMPTCLANASEVVISPDGRNVYAAGQWSLGIAEFERDSATGRISFVDALDKDDPGVDGLTNPMGLAISPDGASLYVIDDNENKLTILSRDRISGKLSYVRTLADGVNGVDGLARPNSVAVSPDGTLVVVTSYDDNAVAAFTRLANGDLQYRGLHRTAAESPLQHPQGSAFSPDGGFVYVRYEWGNGLVVATWDANAGKLSVVQEYRNPDTYFSGGCEVSSDGRSIYILSGSRNAVVVLSRDATTGMVDFVQKVEDGVAGADGLWQPSGIAISPDGKRAYVTALNEQTVSIFNRDVVTGKLTFVREWLNTDELGYPKGVAISGDGKHLYVPAACSTAYGEVAVFAVGQGNAPLALVQTARNEQGGIHGLYGARAVAVTPDGKHVYAMGQFDYSMAIFSRNSATGALTWLDELKDMRPERGLVGGQNIVVSPDGKHAYIYSGTNQVLAAYQRNAGTGRLTFLESWADGQDLGGGRMVDGLSVVTAMKFSPDGKQLYLSSWTDSASYPPPARTVPYTSPRNR